MHALALDFGGTKVAAAIVRDDGTVVRETQTPTNAFVDGQPATGDEIYAGVDAMLRAFLADGDIPTKIGISSAGPIELEDGTVSPVNIPGWRRYPLVRRIVDTLADLGAPGRTPALIGDGHCVALGEHWLGAGRGERSVFGVICSTGVGGGVVIDGVPYQGRTGNAIHFGHTTVQLDGRPCPCGSRGCVEALASGTSMVAIARDKGWQGTDAKQLTDEARAGDAFAQTIVDDAMRALGAGLAAVATNFDVQTVIVGGGVSKAGDVIFEPLRRYFHEYLCLAYVADGARLIPATLPNASLLGAAKWGLDAS